MRFIIFACLLLSGCFKLPWFSDEKKEETSQASALPSSAVDEHGIDDNFECAKKLSEAETSALRSAFTEQLKNANRVYVTEGGGDCIELKAYTLESKDGKWTVSFKDQTNKGNSTRQLTEAEAKALQTELEFVTVTDIQPAGCTNVGIKCEASLTLVTGGKEYKYRPAHSSAGESAEGFLDNKGFSNIIDYLDTLGGIR